ncbi:Spindle assembly checkpoint component mad1 [Vanrija pseudolonga]|uniref:Spindle assembly checkpoint component MAD1 n=1 Tax=Vanrija pseudolonga TaxID=143232 RepID=A0AAF0Y3X0_9TREE|nr:Spindle assembly checkpoint component mad1 [Vanrija pseudolonga]
MERPTPSSSRIPTTLRSGVARTPSTLRTPTASSLGKRAATEAGLADDPLVARKALSASKARETTLERRILELQRSLQQRTEELEETRSLNERLKTERHILLEGETKEKNEGEKREKAWETERKQAIAKIGELRRARNTLGAELEEVNHQHQSLTARYHNLSNSSKSEISLLENRVKDIERERDELRQWQRRAEALSIQLEEEKRKAQDGARRREDAAADRKGDEVVRGELRRQSQNLVSLQHANDSLQAELVDLRRWKKDADAHDRVAKDTERTLKDEVRSLHEQLERARREVDSLTQTFPSDQAASEDASTLQHRLSALSTLHAETEAKLTAKSKETDELHARLATVARDSQSANLALAKRAEEAERELRWAKEGRRRAEVQESLARNELQSYVELGTNPSSASGSGDSAARVTQLESLLESYKSQLEGLARDTRDVEDRVSRGAGLVKLSELEEAREAISRHEAAATELQQTIDQLIEANTKLDAEVTNLMQRVASGEYNPARERLLELRNNPAAKIHAVRTEQLEALKAENTALLGRLAAVDNEPAGQDAESRGLVPRESFDRLVKEKTDQEAAHEKRLLRLKEIFGLKSREFLEAVYSLLGWRIRFDESGADIRLTSMYAPKGKMGLTLKFTSHEGHFGTMQMTGGMARGLEEARDFWVTERQSIPGFLAQVTTEMFEKTTIGRAAGYVGLE